MRMEAGKCIEETHPILIHTYSHQFYTPATFLQQILQNNFPRTYHLLFHTLTAYPKPVRSFTIPDPSTASPTLFLGSHLTRLPYNCISSKSSFLNTLTYAPTSASCHERNTRTNLTSKILLNFQSVAQILHKWTSKKVMHSSA